MITPFRVWQLVAFVCVGWFVSCAPNPKDFTFSGRVVRCEFDVDCPSWTTCLGGICMTRLTEGDSPEPSENPNQESFSEPNPTEPQRETVDIEPVVDEGVELPDEPTTPDEAGTPDEFVAPDEPTTPDEAGAPDEPIGVDASEPIAEEPVVEPQPEPKPEPPPLMRVSKDLVVLYTFVNGSGTKISDQTTVNKKIDLTISKNTNNVKWLSGRNGVRVVGDMNIRNDNADKLHDKISKSGRFTIEAWIKPRDKQHSGPARIVSFSKDSGDRNVTLGQDKANLILRLRTSGDGDNNGQPDMVFPNQIKVAETHYVVTFDGNDVVLYVNGVKTNTLARKGDLKKWNDKYALSLGNEKSDSRLWRGEFYLVAIYSRHLTQAEISQNYQVGSRF